MNDKCAIYVRVSTNKQEVESQIDTLKKAVEVRQWKLVGVFKDEAVSGRRGSRPELDRMKEMIKKGEIDIVYVWRLDRMGRSVPDLQRLIEFYNGHHCQLVSHCEGPVDTTTATGNMFFQFMAILAEFESRLIGERTKLNYQYKKQAAKKIGKKVRWGRKMRTLTKEERKFVYDQREHGLGWRPIADEINRMRKERKGEEISFNTVMRAYKRKPYDPLSFEDA